MSVHSSLRATTSLASQTKSLSNQFRKSCSVKASTTTGRIDATTTALHGKSGRKCMLTGKRANNGYTVSFSHIRNKKMQRANLQVRLRAWFWSRCWLRRASFGRRIRLFLSPLNFIEFIQPSRPSGKTLPLTNDFLSISSRIVAVQTRLLAGTKAIHSLAHFNQSD